MSISKNISADLKTDNTYGDFNITSRDIVLNKNPKYIIKDVILDRVKTQNQDYPLSPESGASLANFIGKGIDRNLAEDLKTAVRYALTYDDFLSPMDLDIVTLVVENTIQIYIYLKMFGEDEEVIRITYTNEGINFD